MHSINEKHWLVCCIRLVTRNRKGVVSSHAIELPEKEEGY